MSGDQQWWTDEDVELAMLGLLGFDPHPTTHAAWAGSTRDALAALTPTVERIRREAKAEAWDEGYDAGDPWQRRGNPAEEKRRLNPYRAARIEAD